MEAGPPPAEPAGVDPFALPSVSVSSLLLLALSAMAAALFAGHWALVLRVGSWRSANQECLRTARDGADAVAFARLFVDCTGQVRREQALSTLVVPAALVVVALAAAVVAPTWQRRRYRVLPADPSGPLAVTFADLAVQSGVSAVPRLEIGLWKWSFAPFVYGWRRPYRVLVPQVMENTALVGGSAHDRGQLRHELAHISASDIRRTHLALGIWVTALVLVVGPLLADVAARHDTVGFPLGWRLCVLAVVVYLAGASIVRAREHDADLLADRLESKARAAEHASAVGGASAVEHASVSDGDSAIGGDSAVEYASAVGGGRDGGGHCSPKVAGDVRTMLASTSTSSRLPRPMRLHPTESRLDVVLEPAAIMRATATDAALDAGVAGIAAGALGTEVSQLLTSLSVGTWPAYALTGSLLAVPVLAVVGLGVWRAVLSGQSRPPTLRPGLALGAGMLLGSQLTPRAAANWLEVFRTADNAAAMLSITGAHPWSAVLLVAAVLLIGVAVSTWLAAAGRAWLPPRLGSPMRCWLWCLAVGVPLFGTCSGAWLLAMRLAVASGWRPRSLALVLSPTPIRMAIVVSVAVAWGYVSLGRVGVLLGRVEWSPLARCGSHGRRRIPTVVTAVAWPLLLTAVLTSQNWARTPATDLIAPPPTTQPGIACVWVRAESTRVLRRAEDGNAQRRLGDYLVTVRDDELRRIGELFQRGAAQHDSEVIRTAQYALLRYCDLVARYGTAAVVPKPPR